MKKTILLISAISILGITTLSLESCKEDDPNFLRIVSVTTDSGMDLSSSEAIDVPLGGTIIVTFNKSVSDPSVGPGAIDLMSGDVTVPSTLLLEDAIITIDPTSNLATGTNYKISIQPNLKGADGSTAETKEVSFQTLGRMNVVPPQLSSQLSYFPFSGDMDDEGGLHTPTAVDVKNLTYGVDRFGFEGLAGSFNGTTTLVEIPQGDLYMNTNNFTLSTWIKSSSAKDGQYILGLGGWKGFYLDIPFGWSGIRHTTQFKHANNTSDAEAHLFAGTGETKDNGGWQGIVFQTNVLPHGGGVGTTYLKNKWVHIVFTYDAATKLSTMYLNGAKVMQTDFNLWPMGDPKRTITGLKYAGNLTGGGNKLALGFIQGSTNRVITESWADPADIYSYHFQGLMDDLRIFKIALTSEEVTTLYNAEKP